MNKLKLGRDAVYILDDRAQLSRALADKFVELANQAVSSHGRFTVALSGGSTPGDLYALLGQPPYSERIPWTQTHLFWGDERCVPHDSAESNYNMVRRSLLAGQAGSLIPQENIHPTAGQDSDPVAAAAAYEKELKQFFGLSDGQLPRFDLNLLGLGPDGHTASLFPGTAALNESARLVVPNYVEKLKSHRITFTLPAINAAANVIFMVAGDDKADILPEVLKEEPKVYPSQLVHPRDGKLEWYVDRAAAGKLDTDK